LAEALRTETTCQVLATSWYLSACLNDTRLKYRLSTDIDIDIQAQAQVRATVWLGTWSHPPRLEVDLTPGIVGVKRRRLM